MSASKNNLGARARAVLRMLVEGGGRTVTKSEILDGAWPGLVVEENNISVQIAALRKVLGAEAIENIPGVGYRLNPHAVPRLADFVDEHAVSTKPAPPSTSELVGRSDDVETLTAMAHTASLITVVGSGGVGKTSVARAVFERLCIGHRDTHWIDLSSISDASQLTALVAEKLSIETAADDPVATMLEAVADSQATLFLDNCEHLLRPVADLVTLARRHAPSIRWIATSQENLHLSFETVYRLEPLALPDADADVEQAMRSASVELMVRRMSTADRHFALLSSNIGSVVRLCTELEGLPLAIEIAAAHAASLGLDAVLEQLQDRLWLPSKSNLDVGRHHSLLAVCEWSYGLLSAEERAVFRRIAPFVGGFTLAMAQRLVTGDFGSPPLLNAPSVTRHLGALVDKCLLQRTRSTPARFSLLETTRDFARTCLGETGEEAAAADRHSRIVADWFEAARTDREQMTDAEWDARYTSERANVRAALLTASSREEPDLMARLAAALARIDWATRSPADILCLDVPLEAILAASPAYRAEAYLELSWSHYLYGHRETGTDLAIRAVADFDALDDAAASYRALGQLIRIYESRPATRSYALVEWDRFVRIDARRIPRYTRLFCALSVGLQYGGTRSLEKMEQMEAECRRAGFTTLAAVCRMQITDELLVQGRFDEVVTRANTYLGAGEYRPLVIGLLLQNQILAMIRLGRTQEAYEPARRAARCLPHWTHMIVTPFCLAFAASQRHEEACLLVGFCEEARKRNDEIPDLSEARAADEAIALLRGSLDAALYEVLVSAGAAMTPSEALALLVPDLSTPSASGPTTGWFEEGPASPAS